MRTLARLLRLAGVRPRDLVSPIIAGSITLLAALSLTVVSGWLITRAWEMPPVLDLSIAVTSVRALGISRAVFRYLDRLVSHRLALDALTTLRARIYDAQAAELSYGAVPPYGSPNESQHASQHLTRAEAQTRLVADTERITDFIVRSVVPAGVAAVLTVAATVFAFILSPAAGAVMLAGFAVTGGLVPALAARAARSSRLIESEAAFLAALDSVLTDRVEYAAAGRADNQIEYATAQSREASRAWVDATRPEATAAALQAWATGLTALGVLWVAVSHYATAGGDPTWVGMLVMLPLAAFEAHGPLPAAAIHADAASRSANRLERLIDAAGESELGGGESSISKCSVKALETIHGDTVWDFELEPGQRMLVRGPSGCGKTTMLATVAGLLPPAGGTVSAPRSARFFAEDAWVFATTIRENLTVANPQASDELMCEALAAVGLDFELSFMLHDGADSLSSGQRRRLLLARALVSEAELLLLDEPFAHLSPDDAAAFQDILMRSPLPGARAQRSVIAVTHTDGPVGVEIFPAP
ncbi:thiol reductant ABC exporter subunit CydC [Corynebacterium aquatimens]|uniref:thiol reductant ABC exporter subunit CydC n=1 Tax=Corynebacterium aquatimens TaxID=1190508 RepID=UPI0018C9921C